MKKIEKKPNNHSECMMNLVVYIIDTSRLNKSLILYFGLNIHMRFLSEKKKTLEDLQEIY